MMDALRTTLKDLLPSGLLDADISMLDRSPNVTVFVDVGVRATQAHVVAVVTNSSFTVALEAALGVEVSLLSGPYTVSERLVTFASPPPGNPPSIPPPAVPGLVTAAVSASALSGDDSSGSTAAFGAIIAATVGAVVAAMGCYLLRLRRRQTKELHVRTSRMSDARLLTNEAMDPDACTAEAAIAMCDPHISRGASFGGGGDDDDDDGLRVDAVPSTPDKGVPLRAERFSAMVRHNSDGEFRIQIIQEEGSADMSIALVGASDVLDDRDMLAPGDVLRQVNGVDVAEKGLRAVQEMLAGSGAAVHLTLERSRAEPSNAMRISCETFEVTPLDDTSSSGDDADVAVVQARKHLQLPSLPSPGSAERGRQLAERVALSDPQASGYSINNAEANLGRARQGGALMRI